MSKRILKLRVLFFGLLSTMNFVLGRIKIHSPTFYENKYKDTEFKYHLSSFGKNPYGHTILGKLKVPYPETACGKTVTVNFDHKDPLILVVKRGGCSFLEKVKNGQSLKAAMVLIVDNVEDDLNYVVPAVEGNEPVNVQIPSLLMDRNDGTTLLKDVQKSVQDSTPDMIASVSFKIQQTERPFVIYNFDLDDRSMYESLYEIMNFYEELKSQTEIFPVYNVYPQEDTDGMFCLNDRKFCQKRNDNSQIETKDQPIFESIRQICLSKLAPDSWFKYVSEFPKHCIEKDKGKGKLAVDLEKCSDRVFDKIKDGKEAKKQISQCVESASVAGKKVEENSNLYRYLIENSRLKDQIISPVMPIVMINGQIMYGSLSALDIVKEICAAFTTKPDKCKEIEKMKRDIHSLDVESSFGFGSALFYLFKLVILGLIVVAAFYLIYKIKLRKEMETKLSSEVDSALANYYMQNKGSKYEGVDVEEHNESGIDPGAHDLSTNVAGPEEEE